MFPQLRIYYSAYGLKTNERYRVNRALVEFVEQYKYLNLIQKYFQSKP